MLPSSTVLAATLAWGSAAGLGAPSEPETIVGGADASLGEFDAVVSFLYQTRFCTGTVVAPRLVLTAGHCLANLPPDADTGMSVRFGASAEAPAAVVDSVDIGVFPDFCPDCLYERHDIGYILLAQSVEVVEGFPTVITDQDDWDATIGEGRRLTMVGFGQTESGSPSPAQSLGLGTKRYVETSMRPHGNAGLDFLAGTFGIDTCDGDSGGPALVQLEDGTWAVAGVLSGGLGECGSGESVYSVPLPALAWIRDETGIDLLPASCGGEDCVDTSVVPDGCGCRQGRPALLAGWWLGIFGLAGLRRRR